MSHWGSSAAGPSSASGGSRMPPGATDAGSGWDLEEYPLGNETGLPLIPCPDCGMARVIERRSMKESTENYLRVYFKCPRNSYPVKMCGFYKFQRQYLMKLKELGIVSVRNSPRAIEIAEADAAAGEATSRRTDMTTTVGGTERQIQAKMDDLQWKLNMVLYALAVVIGAVLMKLAGAAK